MTNWNGPTWVIRDAKGEGGKVLLKANGSNQFDLVPKPDEKNVEFYSVKPVESDAMTRFWEDTKFFPHGATESDRWPFKRKLPRKREDWTSVDDENVMEFEKTLNDRSRRLEATFKVGDKSEPVRLWIAEEAMENGNEEFLPLLVIDIQPPPEEIVKDQSGSGTGDPK